MTNPLSTLMGQGVPACKDMGAASVHYWSSGAVPGDRCLCGAREYVAARPGTNDVPFDQPARCMAVTGTASIGPHYCGNRAKTEVAGRPVCGVHKNGQPGIEWSERLGYPHGPHGRWQFSKGAAR